MKEKNLTKSRNLQKVFLNVNLKLKQETIQEKKEKEEIS